MATIEAELKELTKRVDQLQKENNRLQAVHEIQNMMGRYEYWHTSGKNHEIGNMFARKADGIRVEYANSGVWEGFEGAQRFTVGTHDYFKEGGYTGGLSIHPLTTPVIEIAKDGKTARGLWIAPGYEVVNVDGKKQATWMMEEYAVDFIKEEGRWCFWRIHMYRIFWCSYDKSYVDLSTKEFEKRNAPSPEKQPAHLRPDRPTTIHQTYSLSEKSAMQNYIPPAPESYETYDDSMAVVK
jgi:hypothetical protein